MINILDRVQGSALQAKIVTAEEAALLINPGDHVGISGFTPIRLSESSSFGLS